MATANLAGTIDQLLYTAQFDKLIDACKPELVTARAHDDRNLESLALYGLSAAHLYRGNFEEARSLNEGAIEYAQLSGNKIALARAMMQSGHIHMTATYQSYEANDDYREALRLVEEQDNPALVVSILTGLGGFLLSIGEHSRAQRYAREAFEIAREQDDWIGLVEALHVLGNILSAENKHEPALKALRDALAISLERGMTLYEGLLKGQIGMIYVNSNRHYNEGIELLEEALTLAQDIRCVPHEFTALYSLGVARLNQGQIAAAQDYYDTMLQRAQTWKSREYEGAAFFNLGTLLLVDERYDDAIANYTNAVTISRETKNPFYEARAEQAIGLVHRLEQRYDDALEHYQMARALYLSLDNELQASDMMRAIVLTYIARVVDNLLRMVGLRKNPAALQDNDQSDENTPR